MNLANELNISQAIRSLGVRSGDTVMVHSDMRLLAQAGLSDTSDRCRFLFDALIDVVGAEGTLVVPTFSYSATSGEIYSKSTSQSKVGIFTEYFRRCSGVGRSEDPIFSLAAYGRDIDAYANAKYIDSFGIGSGFDLLYRNNAWLICLGCTFVVTFIHFIEQQFAVPYRTFKKFDARIERDGVIATEEVSYYVRDYSQPNEVNWAALRKKLQDDGLLKFGEIGRLGVYGLRTHDLYNYCSKLIKDDPRGLLFLRVNNGQ
jgi:aminoglycoside 3-N-acetyltransferase